MAEQKSGSSGRRVSGSSKEQTTLMAMVEDLNLDEHQKAIVMDRWLDQTNWFSKKASHAKRRMTQFRVVIIVGGVLLPVLSTLPDTVPGGISNWGTPLVSFMVAATAGLEGLFKYSELHYQYRESAEMLKIGVDLTIHDLDLATGDMVVALA